MKFTVPFAALAAGAILSLTQAAHADKMDPALERLVLDPDCHGVLAAGQTGNPANFGRFNDDPAFRDPNTGYNGTRRGECSPDNVAFKKLINEWGFVLAPAAMHSARTTGFGGFHLSMEGTYTKINSGAKYWKDGTQGARADSSGAASITNTGPADILSSYSIKIRKSFGFGFEGAAQVGFIPTTNIILGGADVRMSLLEGFRTGIGGVFPDVAVGGGVRTITGTSEFQLTTAGLDVQISKPLPIASSAVLTPWIGYQYLWIFGDSGLVDTTPATDPLGYCGFSGPNVPGNADTFRDDKSPGGPNNAPQNQIYDGQPVCAGGSPLDFNNNIVFKRVRLERQRLMFGMNYRYELLLLGAEFITDIVPPEDAQNDKEDTTDLKGTPRQWTLALELGAMF